MAIMQYVCWTIIGLKLSAIAHQELYMKDCMNNTFGFAMLMLFI